MLLLVAYQKPTAAKSYLCVCRSAFSLFVRAGVIAIAAILAAKKMFTRVLERVFEAPVSYFDANPLGLLMNRLSADQQVVDVQVSHTN